MPAFLTRDLILRCSIGHAFKTFTKKIDLWWPKSHRKFADSTLYLDAVVGGVFEERAQSGEVWVLGEVLDCDAPRRIRYSWNPGSVVGPTEVTVNFSGNDDGHTAIQIQHRAGLDAANFEKVMARFEKGWDVILPALRDFAEHDAQKTS